LILKNALDKDQISYESNSYVVAIYDHPLRRNNRHNEIWFFKNHSHHLEDQASSTHPYHDAHSHSLHQSSFSSPPPPPSSVDQPNHQSAHISRFHPSSHPYQPQHSPQPTFPQQIVGREETGKKQQPQVGDNNDDGNDDGGNDENGDDDNSREKYNERHEVQHYLSHHGEGDSDEPRAHHYPFLSILS